MRRFLRFVVERTIDGETDCLKESVIGVQVFDREIGYDPKTDSIVRVEARRLRNKLFEYQRQNGAEDPLWILLPKGGYVPEFVPREVQPELETAGPIAPPRSRRRFVLAGAIVLVLCGAAAWLILAKNPAHAVQVQGRPFTTWPGYEVTPSFSPDGQTIAFASHAIYLQRVGSDQATRITHSDQPEIEPVWSPDGRRIAFFRQESPGRLGIFLVTPTGAEEQKVGTIRSTVAPARMDWLPDGRFIATSDRGAEGALTLVLFSVATGAKQWLVGPQNGDDWCPEISPDGRTLAFVHSLAEGVQDLYLMPIRVGADGKAATEPPRRLTFDNRSIYGHAWSVDGRSIVVSSKRSGGRYDLWRVQVPKGSPVRIAGAEREAIQPSISRKGNRMAYVSRFTDMHIWRARVDGKGEARALIASTMYDTDPQYSPDGTRIAFRSTRSGNGAIWVADVEGMGASRVADLNGPTIGAPRWSPDGRMLSFDARAGEQSVIYLAPANSSAPPRPLAGPSEANDMLPSWSADGKFLYFGSSRSGRWDLWKQPVSGGRAEQITRDGGFDAFETADGKYIYYSKGPMVPGIWRLPGEELVLPSASAPKWGWILGKSGIYFVDAAPGEEQPANIRFYDFATKATRLIGRTSAKPALGGTSISVSPDEQWIAWAQVDRAGSDIILVENFR
jgi:Tol biopolymer transport system component